MAILKIKPSLRLDDQRGLLRFLLGFLLRFLLRHEKDEALLHQPGQKRNV